MLFGGKLDLSALVETVVLVASKGGLRDEEVCFGYFSKRSSGDEARHSPLLFPPPFWTRKAMLKQCCKAILTYMTYAFLMGKITSCEHLTLHAVAEGDILVYASHFYTVFIMLFSCV